MTPFIKPAAVGIASLLAAGALVYQNRQVQSQHVENALLEGRIAELEAASQATPATSPPDPTGLAAPEKSELLRLRSDVTKLRAENRALAARLAKPNAAGTEPVNESVEAADPVVIQANIDALKHVGLALRILTTEAEATPELLKIQFGDRSELPKIFKDTLVENIALLDQIELLVPDMTMMVKAEQMPEVIIARSREAFPAGNGTFYRIYCGGDGSVHKIVHTGAQEVLGWGQTIEGTEVKWSN